MQSLPGYSRLSKPVFSGANGKPFPGKQFDVDWLCEGCVSFRDVEHIYNTCNDNKSIKVGRDGQEIDWIAGGKLLDLLFRAAADGVEQKKRGRSDFSDKQAAFDEAVGQSKRRRVSRSSDSRSSSPLELGSVEAGLPPEAIAELTKSTPVAKATWEAGALGDGKKCESGSNLFINVVRSSNAMSKQLSNIAASLKQSTPSISPQTVEKAAEKVHFSNSTMEDKTMNMSLASHNRPVRPMSSYRLDRVGLQKDRRLTTSPFSWEDLVEMNPLLSIFPIDLTQLTYKTYCQLYDLSAMELTSGDGSHLFIPGLRDMWNSRDWTPDAASFLSVDSHAIVGEILVKGCPYVSPSFSH